MKKIIAIMALCVIITAGTVSAQAAANVAALMYHSVRSDPARWDDFTVSVEQLDNDIQYFKDCGYITMTATELATANMADIDGRKILLLTFDDGYSNFYTEIFPVLQKHNAKATMFLVGSYINRYGYLTEDETYEMAHSGLVEIGNHTNGIHQAPVESLHAIYTDKTGMLDVIADIKSNGEKLKKITGIDVTSISWPYGYYTQELDSAVKDQLGYKISFSTDYGVNKFTGNTAVPLKRMNREFSASTQWVFDRANGKF
ncbi:MAG: polysaccharide deacetylase family protein [Clostridia bacterium]|nr:polysaccharide deacetylase family protein [Clostridia bacterium]